MRRALMVGMVIALLMGSLSQAIAPARAEEADLLPGEAAPAPKAAPPTAPADLVEEPPDPRPAALEVEEKAALRIALVTERMRNLELSMELGRRQLNDLAAEREQIGREAAKAAGLAWDDYNVDLTQRPLVWRLKKR